MDPSEVITWIWGLSGDPRLHLIILISGYAWLGRRVGRLKHSQRILDRELRDVRAALDHLRKIIGWRRRDVLLDGQVREVLPMGAIGATLDPEQEAAIRGKERRKR
jgi:hypothetical protein